MSSDLVTGGRVEFALRAYGHPTGGGRAILHGPHAEGYEQPVGEVYKLLTEKFGGDPNSTINQIAEGTIVGLTDPVSYIAPEVAAEKMLGGRVVKRTLPESQRTIPYFAKDAPQGSGRFV